MRRTLALMVFTMLPATLAYGTRVADVSSADRIEEDWELVVATPDPDANGPQVTTIMNPLQDSTSDFLVFNLNYQDYPTFVAGGLQAKVWKGGSVASTDVQGSGQLQTTGETVTWTQSLSLSDGTIRFKILSGQSTKWGKFNLSASAATTLSTLAAYSPQNSASKSAVSYAANCVTSLTLVRTRYYQDDTLLRLDTTRRPVTLSN
ncbi:MAG: hypothetical protein JWN86_1571 [Planctomycetota bacterium]|nr:hypothetical protein [Planctomycetota bacterium]